MSTQVGYISLYPLQLDTAVWLKSGQWNVRRRMPHLPAQTFKNLPGALFYDFFPHAVFLLAYIKDGRTFVT